MTTVNIATVFIYYITYCTCTHESVLITDTKSVINIQNEVNVLSTHNF